MSISFNSIDSVNPPTCPVVKSLGDVTDETEVV
jgi:hypothetical protein